MTSNNSEKVPQHRDAAPDLFLTSSEHEPVSPVVEGQQETNRSLVQKLSTSTMPPCGAGHGPYTFPVPMFSQAPATGRWTTLIEQLLTSTTPIKDLLPGQQLRALLNDATTQLSSEPTCLYLNVRSPGQKAAAAMEKLANPLSSGENHSQSFTNSTPGEECGRAASPERLNATARPGFAPSPLEMMGKSGAASVGYEVDEDLVLVGDIHGQYIDLLQAVFAVQGRARLRGASEKTFLFLGDYVDRGSQSVEVLVLLLALKIEYPNRIFLLRGNHEESNTCKMYGFMAECRAKLHLQAWYLFTAVFSEIPLAAIVCTPRGRMFCCHGGLSPGLIDAAEETLNFTIRQSYGQALAGGDDIIDGLLWSDPVGGRGFRPNTRGCGQNFGPDATERFLALNGFDLVVRAHQMVQQGYHWDHDYRVLTVFSAPRYCGFHDNLGSICIVHANEYWLELDQSQPMSLDAATREPLRVSPIVSQIGRRKCVLEKIMEFSCFDSFDPDVGVPPANGDDADELPKELGLELGDGRTAPVATSSPPLNPHHDPAPAPGPAPQLDHPALEDYFAASLDGHFFPGGDADGTQLSGGAGSGSGGGGSGPPTDPLGDSDDDDMLLVHGGHR